MSKTPHPGDLYAQYKKNLQDARERFPAQFSKPMISCAWPDGWNPLVTRVFSHIDGLRADVYWSQIKEKFGGLRLYYDGGPVRLDIQTPDSLLSLRASQASVAEDIEAVVNEAETLSLSTCCKCGGAGVMVSFGGWWLTACETCVPLIQQYRNRDWSEEEGT